MSGERPRPATTPVVPLAAIAGLIVFTLLAVATVRLLGIPAGEPPAAAVTERALHFEDRPGGVVAVVDAQSGEVLERAAPGEDGFLRATVRGLAQQRLREGSGPGVPFTLSGRADGRLLLEDPVTGRRVDLTAFGPTNAAVFARLLTAQREPGVGERALAGPGRADG